MKKLIFLIHGFAGGKFQLAPLIEFLESNKEYDLIVPTLTGHTEDYAGLDLENASKSKWIMDVVDKFYEVEKDYDEIYLMGHSMGGLLLTNLYRLVRSEKIKKIVYLSAAFYISEFLKSKEIIKLVDEGRTMQQGEGNSEQLNRIKKVTIRSIYELTSLSIETRDYLKDISIPCFVLQGDRDGLVSAQSPYKMYDSIPNSSKNKLKIYEGANHNISFCKQSSELFKDIIDFIEE